MLTKALGDDRAATLIRASSRRRHRLASRALKGWTPHRGRPDPQTNTRKSSPPSHCALDYDHAGEILGSSTERLRNDVLLRIATLEGVQPERCAS